MGEPDQRLAGRFDEHGDQRDFKSADLVRQTTEQHPPEDERAAHGGERDPRLVPAVLREDENDERRDRTEADAAECEPQTRQQHGPQHARERRAILRFRRHSAERRDEAERQQRHQRRRQADRSESVRRIKRRADRRADGIGAVHRSADPGHHRAGILGADERQSPTQRAHGDEAFRRAEQHPSRQQDRDGYIRRGNERTR